MSLIEVPQRIEPARFEQPSEAISDVVAELSAAAATLGQALHPRTGANLAALVRIMNAYYSNLIEGHNTRPRDIQRALAGDFDRTRIDETSRSKLRPMSTCRPKLTAWLPRTAWPSQRHEIFLNGSIRNFIGTHQRRCCGFPVGTVTLSCSPGSFACSQSTMSRLDAMHRRQAIVFRFSWTISRAVTRSGGWAKLPELSRWLPPITGSITSILF